MKYHITSVLQDFADIFSNVISFRHVLHFGVDRSQLEWNMKVKIEISICTGLMLNDHSNPYIESTTVLSDGAAVSPGLWMLRHSTITKGDYRQTDPSYRK